MINFLLVEVDVLVLFKHVSFHTALLMCPERKVLQTGRGSRGMGGHGGGGARGWGDAMNETGGLCAARWLSFA